MKIKIFNIVKKDIRILIRSKSSALIVVLGPLLVVLMVGLAFNTSNVNSIKIGVYSSSYSELSESLISVLRDNAFSVTKAQSASDCIEEIKAGSLHLCIEIPADLAVEANKTNELVFHVDNSRINLVYLILDRLSSKLSIKTTEISKQLTQVLIDTLSNSRVELIQNKKSLSEIKTKSDDVSAKVDSITQAANDLDVDVDLGPLNIPAIIAEVNKQNSSSTTLKNLVADLETNANELEASVESQVSQARNKIGGEANTIKDIAGETKSSASELDSSLNKIVTSIEGIRVAEAESIVNPIRTKIVPISEKSTNLNFLFPTLVALIIMFVSILLSSTIVIREKKTRAYFRNFITPTSNFTFLIGVYLTCLIILVLQLVIMFGQAFYFFQGTLTPVLLNVSVVLFLVATVFIFLGIFIGYIFQSEETSTLAAMSVAAVLLFLSNTILPVETIPENLKWIALFNPFVIADSMLKKLILFGAPLSSVLAQLYMLLSYLALFLVSSFLARLITKRRFG